MHAIVNITITHLDIVAQLALNQEVFSQLALCQQTEIWKENKGGEGLEGCVKYCLKIKKVERGYEEETCINIS